MAAYRRANLDLYAAHTRKHRADPINRQKFREYMAAYRRSDEFKAQRREKDRKRYAEDIAFRTSIKMRKRINEILKSEGLKKPSRTHEILGCTSTELVTYLNVSGCNRSEYEIDHKIAIALWDLKCPLQFALCFHFTNLQVLTKEKHWEKSRNDNAKIRLKAKAQSGSLMGWPSPDRPDDKSEGLR